MASASAMQLPHAHSVSSYELQVESESGFIKIGHRFRNAPSSFNPTKPSRFLLMISDPILATNGQCFRKAISPPDSAKLSRASLPISDPIFATIGQRFRKVTSPPDSAKLSWALLLISNPIFVTIGQRFRKATYSHDSAKLSWALSRYQIQYPQKLISALQSSLPTTYIRLVLPSSFQHSTILPTSGCSSLPILGHDCRLSGTSLAAASGSSSCLLLSSASNPTTPSEGHLLPELKPPAARCPNSALSSRPALELE